MLATEPGQSIKFLFKNFHYNPSLYRDITLELYSRDEGWFRLPRLNAGCKSRKNARKSIFLDLPSSYGKIWGEPKFQLQEFSERNTPGTIGVATAAMTEC